MSWQLEFDEPVADGLAVGTIEAPEDVVVPEGIVVPAAATTAPPPRRLYLPELRIAWRPPVGDIPAWDFDCEGGDLGGALEPPQTVALYVDPTGRLGTALWRCKRNHWGCRVWRWERDESHLLKVITAPELYVDVVDGAWWTRMRNRRKYLSRTRGITSDCMSVLHDNGLRLVESDVDITPRGAPPMRRMPRADAIDKFGRHHVKASAVRREYSDGWRPPDSENESIAMAGRDRMNRARKRAGIEHDRLPEGMSHEEARDRMEEELVRLDLEPRRR